MVLGDIAETKNVSRKRLVARASKERLEISLQMCFRATELCPTPVKLFDKANSRRKKFQIIGNVLRAALRTFHTISHTFLRINYRHFYTIREISKIGKLYSLYQIT